jgi:3'-phosphoadenosine 5'-phosphosulfate sulfotransferase (PAPS reductase)/FAD synthetase
VRTQITAAALVGLDAEAALFEQQTARELGRKTGRYALTWRPLLDWTTDDVWAANGTSQADLDERRARYRAGDKVAALAGWPCHPAYVYGVTRVSCAVCILQSKADMRIGVAHNPALAAAIAEQERRSGFTFRQGLAVGDLLAAQQRAEAVG